ncbi:MAG: hypothetical protein VW405_12620 [Rhodospirillaceae bacterium]
MSPRAHIAVGLAGAVRLVKMDTTGFDYLGKTTADFWRSFLAAAVVAPLFLLYLVIRYVSLGGGSDGPILGYLAVQGLAFAIAWLAFPTVMISLAVPLGRTDRVVHYLVANNWVSVLQNAVYLPIIILGLTGSIPAGFANMLAFVALLWVLALTWFVTKEALDLPGSTAAGIVVMDLLLGLVIEVLTDRAA